MTILITGVTGFVGPYLRAYLEKLGVGEIYGTSFAPRQGDPHVLQCNIDHEHEVDQLIAKIRPDLVFHLAAQSSPRKSFEQPDETMRTNVGGTEHLLTALQKYVPHCKILLISSSEVYGKPQQVPISEDALLQPISPYGVSKLEEEKLLKKFPELHIIISRSFNHTGPGQSSHFVLPDFSLQIAKIEAADQTPIFYKGNTSAIRDFTDVRDIVKAYWLLMEQGKSHEIYNVGSGRGYLLDDVITLLSSYATKEIEIKTDPARMRPVDIPSVVADISKLHTCTGWLPEITLEQTLHDLLQYSRTQLSH